MMPNKIILQNMRTLAEMQEWVSDPYDAAMQGTATPAQQRALAQSFFTLCLTMQLNGYESAQNASQEVKANTIQPDAND